MLKTKIMPSNCNNINETANRIRQTRALSGLTRPELEKNYDVKNTTLAKWESGVTMLSLKGAHQLVNAFKANSVFCTAEWLLTGTGEEPYVVSFSHPVVSPEIITKDPAILLMEELRSFKKIYSNAVVCLINDDTMLPQFALGDYVGGVKIEKEDIGPLFNKACIVEFLDGRKKLRQVIPGRQFGLYNLYATNMRARLQPSILMDVELKTIAPIVWHRFLGD